MLYAMLTGRYPRACLPAPRPPPRGCEPPAQPGSGSSSDAGPASVGSVASGGGGGGTAPLELPARLGLTAGVEALLVRMLDPNPATRIRMEEVLQVRGALGKAEGLHLLVSCTRAPAPAPGGCFEPRRGPPRGGGGGSPLTGACMSSKPTLRAPPPHRR
jgi:hypothetical protein